MQSLFAGFFVLFMIDGLNHTELQAGAVYAVSSFSAIFARIIWGLWRFAHVSAHRACSDRLIGGGQALPYVCRRVWV